MGAPSYRLLGPDGFPIAAFDAFAQVRARFDLLRRELLARAGNLRAAFSSAVPIDPAAECAGLLKTVMESAGLTVEQLAELLSDDGHLSDFEFRFIRTCQALRSLLDHLNLVVQVDTKAKCILDASKRRNNVIVDQALAGPFFDWLATVPGGAK